MSNLSSGNRKDEFTIRAVVLGIILAVIMGAANAYLGLYAGMTVSASIPAAVISMGILRGLLRKGSIYENNIVQTMASAGESLAAGIIFTVPALIISGQWTKFHFWPTTIAALCGGLLGVIFMIPLRRVLILDEKELTYPEGVACAQVLRAGQQYGADLGKVLIGIGGGAVIKLFTSGFCLLQSTLEKAVRIGDRILYAGMDVSPALIAVGYIVQLKIAVLIFLGGFLAWNIVLPMIPVPDPVDGQTISEAASAIWSAKIRYIGVGAMIIGGIWSIISVRKGISKGLKRISKSLFEKGETEDMNPKLLLGILILLFPLMYMLYYSLVENHPIALIACCVMIIFAFFFTAVSSYIVGLVGSSNNPVSGMTICGLLGTAFLLMLVSIEPHIAIAATLGISAVVCCAACTAGDLSQDLKTGSIIQATPRWQQIAQICGVSVSAFVLAPVLALLHNAYGIGTGLKAPQATLFASIAKGFFGGEDLPYNYVYYGIALGILVIILDSILQKYQVPFRLHLMPLAVGIYLPVSLSVPIFLGGFVRWLADRNNSDSGRSEDNPGILMSSGLIAGEAIMGIILAIFIYFNIPLKIGFFQNTALSFLLEGLTLGVIILVCIALALSRRQRSR